MWNYICCLICQRLWFNFSRPATIDAEEYFIFSFPLSAIFAFPWFIITRVLYWRISNGEIFYSATISFCFDSNTRQIIICVVITLTVTSISHKSIAQGVVAVIIITERKKRGKEHEYYLNDQKVSLRYPDERPRYWLKPTKIFPWSCKCLTHLQTARYHIPRKFLTADQDDSSEARD